MTYPKNDTDFEDHKIDKVQKQSDGTYMISHDGWCLWCGDSCPAVPAIGQMARFYGGGQVRGLFIEGVRIWYRSKDEQKEHNEIQMYGKDSQDWLDRWDKGQSVWSIEMGGLGPGYEQCIHVTAAEILRWYLANSDFSRKRDDETYWKAEGDRMEEALFEVPVVKQLGLSGAQWGAAHNLAWRLYQDGPRSVMNDERVKDRHIQVSKNFPGSVAA